MSIRTRTSGAIASFTLIFAACACILSTSGCQSSGRSGGIFGTQSPVRQVICIYDRKPWISVDAQGDSDPEGIRYRVFLDAGKNRGVFRDGILHVEMYVLRRDENGNKRRELASDWHYPTSTFSAIRAKILGDGYLLSLRWASKKFAGRNVEFVTTFEDPVGRKTRASTKRFRIPKYDDYLGQVN